MLSSDNVGFFLDDSGWVVVVVTGTVGLFRVGIVIPVVDVTVGRK